MYLDFLKKNKDKKVYLFGSGEHIRPREEMAKIDVKEADAAFKLYKKELLDSIVDTGEYINACIQKNVETFKLPRKVLEGKVI